MEIKDEILSGVQKRLSPSNGYPLYAACGHEAEPNSVSLRNYPLKEAFL